MPKNDYERGFADGYQRGFKAGQAMLLPIPQPYYVPYYVPTMVPHYYPYQPTPLTPYFYSTCGNTQGIWIGQTSNFTADASFNVLSTGTNQ
jgi:hypothetical protein